MKNAIKKSGRVTKIKYRNSDNWAVFTIDKQSCTGVLPEIIDVGSMVEVHGDVVNSKYGKQLKCDSIIPVATDNNDLIGVACILKRLPGVGPVKAEKFVKQHGDKSLDVAKRDPASIPVTPGKEEEATAILQILTEYAEQYYFLLGIGLTNYQSDRIITKYKSKAKEVVSQNPYKLSDDLDGFGFLSADKVALKAGIGVGSDARISACIKYCLRDSQVNLGNTYIEGWRLCTTVLEQLRESALNNKVGIKGLPGKDEVRELVYRLEKDGVVKILDGKVSDTTLWKNEKLILENFK